MFLYSSYRALLRFIAFVIILVIMTDVSINVPGNVNSRDTSGLSLQLQKVLQSVPNFQEFVKSFHQNVRPWGQFANTSNFKMPPNIPRFFKRAVNNVSYFQGNYLIVSLVLMAYCLLTSPLLLLSVIASLFTCYLLSLRNAERKLIIQGREVTLQHQYGIVALASVPIYYWAGVGEAVFWVIGASCLVISLHAGLYNIDEIINEKDQFDILIQQI